MSEKLKPVYKSKDGSDHASEAEAVRHNEFLNAKEAFNGAAVDVRRFLMKNAKTADGEWFDAMHSRTYWRIFNRYGGGMPRLVELWLHPHSATIDATRAEETLSFRYFDYDHKTYISHPINELYFRKDAARAAHYAACVEWHEEVGIEIAALKESAQ